MTPSSETPRLTFAGDLIGEHLAWTSEGQLKVTSDRLLDKVAKPYLSVSTHHALQSCPARKVIEVATRGGFDLLGAAEVGGAAHLVMERLMLRPPALRTPEAAAHILVNIARDLEPEPGVENYAAHLGADPTMYAQWVGKVTAAYTGLFAIEDPTTVEVVATELKLDGISLAGVPFVGYIDRVDRVEHRSARVLKVVDYKSGKPKLKPNAMFGDDHGDQIQIYVEAAALVLGERPKKGELYYTGAGGGRRAVAVSAPHTKKAVRGFRESWDALNAMAATRTFQTRKSALCGWCPLVNACPTAQAAGMTDRKSDALTAAEIGIKVESSPAPSSPEVEVPPTRYVEHDEFQDRESIMTEQATAQGTEQATPSRKMWADARPFDGPIIGEGESAYPNLSAYAAGNRYGLVSLAVELLHTGKQPLTRTAITALAHTLATIHYRVQRRVTGHFDQNSGAATRLSGAMRTAIEVSPVPFGQPIEAWNTWVNQVMNRATTIAEVSNDLILNGANQDYPWRALAATPFVEDSAPQGAWDEPVAAV